jgi:hypothetical protein
MKRLKKGLCLWVHRKTQKLNKGNESLLIMPAAQIDNFFRKLYLNDEKNISLLCELELKFIHFFQPPTSVKLLSE